MPLLAVFLCIILEKKLIHIKKIHIPALVFIYKIESYYARCYACCFSELILNSDLSSYPHDNASPSLINSLAGFHFPWREIFKLGIRYSLKISLKIPWGLPTVLSFFLYFPSVLDWQPRTLFVISFGPILVGCVYSFGHCQLQQMWFLQQSQKKREGEREKKADVTYQI